MDSEGSFGTETRSIDPIGRLDEATSMNSLLDPFLYELVRAHEQELLEAARVSRVLGTGNRRAFAA